MIHVNVNLTRLKCQNILGSKYKYITTKHTVIVITYSHPPMLCSR